MASLNLITSLGAFVNDLGKTGADIAYDTSSSTFAGVGSWIAQQFVYHKTIEVNTIAFATPGPTSASNLDITVGICTSVGTNGLYPSTQNNTVGSATTLNFVSNANFTYTNALASNILKVVSLSNSYIINNNDIVWFGAVVTSRTSGSIQIGGFADDNYLGRYHNSILFYNQSGVQDSGEYRFYFVPGYYSGSGDTVWYMDMGNTAIDIARTHGTSPYYEYGCEFEINDFITQTLDLQSFTFLGMNDKDGNTSYTCKIYDTNLNVIGIAQTEKGYGQTGTANERHGYEFYFIPPIKINPDYKYIVGIAGTGFTTNTGFHNTLYNNSDILKSHYKQTNMYVFRTDPNSTFSNIGSTTSVNCKFNFTASSKMNRSIGN